MAREEPVLSCCRVVELSSRSPLRFSGGAGGTGVALGTPEKR